MTVRHAVLVVVLAAVGCGDSAKTDTPAPKAPPAQPKAPLVDVKKAADWCGEHGVPESVCTRCNEELVAAFKEKGDWCEKHGLPKSQCVTCDPSLEAKLAAMKPK